MGRVELALEALQPVAVHDGAAQQRFRGWAVKFEIIEFRRRLLAAHIGPHHAAGLFGRVMGDRHLLGEGFAGLGRLGGGVHHDARDVDFPAVEDAAETVFLVARQGQRRTAVRAGFVENADAAVGSAKRHKVFAEQAEALRSAVGLETLGAQGRGPELAQHLSHRRAGADLGQTLVIFFDSISCLFHLPRHDPERIFEAPGQAHQYFGPRDGTPEMGCYCFAKRRQQE